jgi:hypothetical protein
MSVRRAAPVPTMDPATPAMIAAYRAVGVSEEAVVFARQVVTVVAPRRPARARSLLWATSRLAGWAQRVGLGLVPEVVLHPSTIERFVTVGMVGASGSARRTARTNLRFVAVRAVGGGPPPSPLPRQRAKRPYTAAEIDAYLGLAAHQPTASRRHRLTALVCLGAGAGLTGQDLRHVTGGHVQRLGEAMVVIVEGRRSRVVPVLARYHHSLWAAARFAGDRYLTGGLGPWRHNVTNALVASVAGGIDLPPLQLSRLRATWLATHADRLGLPALFAAAGFTHSQHLCDLVTQLPTPTTQQLIARLGNAP